MASDYQGSSSPSLIRFGRSILSMKRDPDINNNNIHWHHEIESTSEDQELQAFQTHVAQRFLHLSSSFDSHQFLSLSWLSNLLDAFLCSQQEFKAILFDNKSYINSQTIDKSVSDYLERSVKGLDICNAIRDGIQQIRQWQNQLEIVSSVLSNQKYLGDLAQFRRANKALRELQVGMMLDIVDKGSSSAFAHRNRSFQKDSNHHQKQFRSLSWSVSRSWSASKQLEAIGNNIVPPKTNNVVAVAVYTMSNVLLFVMWTLVAAIPCQDRGLQPHFNVPPKSFAWGAPIAGMHDRILEESKKRGRRNACGLLKEIQGIASLVNELMVLPLKEEQVIIKRVEEVGMVYDAIKNGLDPLEKQVREVFHGIVRTRTQGLDTIAFSKG